MKGLAGRIVRRYKTSMYSWGQQCTGLV